MWLLRLINDSPIWMQYGSLALSVYFRSFFLLILFVCQFVGIYINYFIKEVIFKTIYSIYGSKTGDGLYIPILGIGNRPLGAKCCDELFNCEGKLSKSFGMPSGHAQSIGILISMVLLFWYNQNKKGKKLERIRKMMNEKWEWILVFIFITLGVFYTRVYYTHCHTIQQVIIGFLVGLGIGYIGFDIYSKMNETYFLKDVII